MLFAGKWLSRDTSVRSAKHVGKGSSTMAASFERFSDKDHSCIEIGIRCVAKGYQECQFQVKTGETFNVVKKVGDKGRAFKIIDTKRGQLGPGTRTPSMGISTGTLAGDF